MGCPSAWSKVTCHNICFPVRKKWEKETDKAIAFFSRLSPGAVCSVQHGDHQPHPAVSISTKSNVKSCSSCKLATFQVSRLFKALICLVNWFGQAPFLPSSEVLVISSSCIRWSLFHTLITCAYYVKSSFFSHVDGLLRSVRASLDCFHFCHI